MSNLISQAREKKLETIRKKLEEEFSLREATVIIGNLLQSKIQYLPVFTIKEKSLLRKIVQTYTWEKVIEALEFALTKPEVYFMYYGKEVISFMSFYNNLPYIMQVLPQKGEPKISLPEYPPEEEKNLSPFMKGVLGKMKNILEKKKE